MYWGLQNNGWQLIFRRAGFLGAKLLGPECSKDHARYFFHVFFHFNPFWRMDKTWVKLRGESLKGNLARKKNTCPPKNCIYYEWHTYFTRSNEAIPCNLNVGSCLASACLLWLREARNSSSERSRNYQYSTTAVHGHHLSNYLWRSSNSDQKAESTSNFQYFTISTGTK